MQWLKYFKYSIVHGGQCHKQFTSVTYDRKNIITLLCFVEGSTLLERMYAVTTTDYSITAVKGL